MRATLTQHEMHMGMLAPIGIEGIVDRPGMGVALEEGGADVGGQLQPLVRGEFAGQGDFIGACHGAWSRGPSPLIPIGHLEEVGRILCPAREGTRSFGHQILFDGPIPLDIAQRLGAVVLFLTGDVLRKPLRTPMAVAFRDDGGVHMIEGHCGTPMIGLIGPFRSLGASFPTSLSGLAAQEGSALPGFLGPRFDLGG